MITHTHRPLRVILYEGTGSIALPAESRAKVMMALLDKGYAVTRSGQGASAVPHDDRSLLVLGAFEGKAPTLEDATGQITIDTRDITGLAPDAIVAAFQRFLLLLSTCRRALAPRCIGSPVE